VHAVILHIHAILIPLRTCIAVGVGERLVPVRHESRNRRFVRKSVVERWFRRPPHKSRNKINDLAGRSGGTAESLSFQAVGTNGACEQPGFIEALAGV
jgi:hypothetical protein